MMDKKEVLVIATSNPGKAKEIQEVLKDLPLEIKTLKDFPQITPPEEAGKTFFENALLKAKYYAEKTGCLCLADDSGLEVEALGGAPGIYSSRYAGEDATDEENNKKLLKELEGVPLEKRRARFVCVIVVCYPDGKYIKSEGIWEGRIALEPRGSFGFGYFSSRNRLLTSNRSMYARMLPRNVASSSSVGYFIGKRRKNSRGMMEHSFRGFLR